MFASGFAVVSVRQIKKDSSGGKKPPKATAKTTKGFAYFRGEKEGQENICSRLVEICW